MVLTQAKPRTLGRVPALICARPSAEVPVQSQAELVGEAGGAVGRRAAAHAVLGVRVARVVVELHVAVGIVALTMRLGQAETGEARVEKQ